MDIKNYIKDYRLLKISAKDSIEGKWFWKLK